MFMDRLEDLNNIPESDIKNDIMKSIDVVVGQNNIDQNRINQWIQNFTGDALQDEELEHKLAYWLLYNFTYFNESEVKHMCKSLLNKFIHSILIKRIYNELDKDQIKDVLNEVYFRGIGEPSESGDYILYLFRQVNHIPVSLFNAKNNNKKIVTFIDDVSLSGQQAYETIKNSTLSNDTEIYLLTFITTEHAVEKLNELNVNVIYCIVLDDSSKAFSENSYVFYNLKDVKDQCEKMCYYYGKKCYKDHPLGYDNGQLLIGFYYTVPNETLPIFWSDSNGWNRLFERYGKSNGLWRLIDELGRYV